MELSNVMQKEKPKSKFNLPLFLSSVFSVYAVVMWLWLQANFDLVIHDLGSCLIAGAVIVFVCGFIGWIFTVTGANGVGSKA